MTGDIRYHKVASKNVGDERPVWVYLPPSYHQSPDKKYQVMYALDGQNLFERGTAFAGQEWGMDEVCQGLMEGGQIEDAIVVAVANGGAKRMEEYTSVKDPDYGGGGSANFERFLIEEVKPMIDSSYRTRTDAESTSLMGSSLGGLATLDIATRHPDVFGGNIAPLSPSAWWSRKWIVKQLQDTPAENFPNKVVMTVGAEEKDIMVEGARAVKQVLLEKGFVEGKNLFYAEVRGGTHSEHSWGQQLPDVFHSIYHK